MNLISLLLFLALATAASTLLLFALRSPNFSKFNKLLDLHLFFNRRLNNVLLPLLLNLRLSELLSLLLHARFLCLRLFLQILGLQIFIFVTHQLAFLPLFQSFSVVQCFILLESFLDFASLCKLI